MAHNLRVKDSDWKRAEKLLPLARTNPLVADILGEEKGPQPLLRAALHRGLRELEQELQPVPAAPAAAEAEK